MTRRKLKTKFEPGHGYTREDWDAVPDNAGWTAEGLKKAKPFAEVFPDLMESIKRARGRPRVESPKQAVTLRLDPSTLDKFRATGKDWRARMVKALEKAKV